MPDVMAYGRWLRSHRERVRLSQREVADAVRISHNTVAKLEAGRIVRPRMDMVDSISEVLERYQAGTGLRDEARALLGFPLDGGASLPELPEDVDYTSLLRWSRRVRQRLAPEQLVFVREALAESDQRGLMDFAAPAARQAA